MSREMANVTAEKDTRLAELDTEYLKATLLLEEGYVSYDKYEEVDRVRGVLKDVCASCVEEVYYDIDWCVSNGAGYEGHEDMVGATCALCNEDFWGMKGGSLVLFEPKFSLERWG